MSTQTANEILAEEAELESSIASWVDDAPAWGLSLLVHGIIGVVLMSVSWVIVNETEFQLTAELPVEEQKREYVIDADISQVVGNTSNLELAGPSLAAAQQSGFENHREKIAEIEEQINPQLPVLTTLPVPSEAELLEEVDLMGTTEHPGGTDGAIDRITWEIAASLRERQTIVVWLFDESLSLKERRGHIADRFTSIYTQLAQLDVNAEENLTTGIVGFGQDVHMLQGSPSSDTDALVRKIRGIDNDESGAEFVFTAVDRAVKTFVPHKRKQRANLMFVIVTDERGDDYAGLESVIQKCTRTGVRVYCIGNSAIFGREKGYVRYAWEADGDNFEDDIPVDQGPETAMVEGLQLPFWSPNGLNLHLMSSGFGPYALSRLCAETGGIYFVADDSLGRNFDLAIMRQYAPDYRPLKNYLGELESNRAKSALVKAAQYAVPDNAIPRPVRRFAASSDAVLRQQITIAQQPFATLDYYLEELHRLLEPGTADRDELDSDRWRASFDLALGRVLAMRVRAFGYNMMLAEMKTKPRTFEREGSNLWMLRPSEGVDAGPRVKKMHDQALEYLHRVIAEHPSTPWARLAAVELEEPFGWSWYEGTMPEQRAMADNGNQPRFAPEDRERQRRQQRAQKREATRPKL